MEAARRWPDLVPVAMCADLPCLTAADLEAALAEQPGRPPVRRRRVRRGDHALHRAARRVRARVRLPVRGAAPGGRRPARSRATCRGCAATSTTPTDLAAAVRLGVGATHRSPSSPRLPARNRLRAGRRPATRPQRTMVRQDFLAAFLAGPSWPRPSWPGPSWLAPSWRPSSWPGAFFAERLGGGLLGRRPSWRGRLLRQRSWPRPSWPAAFLAVAFLAAVFFAGAAALAGAAFFGRSGRLRDDAASAASWRPRRRSSGPRRR